MSGIHTHVIWGKGGKGASVYVCRKLITTAFRSAVACLLALTTFRPKHADMVDGASNYAFIPPLEHSSVIAMPQCHDSIMIV